MRPLLTLSVPGGNTHTVPHAQFEMLQALVAETNTTDYPTFLRLGNIPTVRMQPIGARGLLGEVDLFTSRLRESSVPGVRFLDGDGVELGAMYARNGNTSVAATNWTVTPDGIKVVLNSLPPPVGFRSVPGLAAGEYQCFFSRLTFGQDECLGIRTAAMGGSGAPVILPALPVPPVTRWDLARVAGRPDVTTAEWVETPVPEVYRDILHAFVSACHEALRLRQPLSIRRT